MLLGMVPSDRQASALDSIDEGHGFVEVSRSWLHRSWRHERHLTGLPRGRCLGTDRLVIIPPVFLAQPGFCDHPSGNAAKPRFAWRYHCNPEIGSFHRRLISSSACA